jgi:phage baseplate assembly protein gpV
MTIDSDDYPGSSSLQARSIWCDGGAFSFDFVNHAYFVEVTMTRTTLPASAGLDSIQIGRTTNGCLAAPGD